MERIYVSEPVLDAREQENLETCLEKNWLTQGPFVAQFERRFAAFCSCAHGVATTSGTTALHLLLASLGIQPGDEVILPNLTFVATANAVTYCGAKPVLVDVEDSTWNIDPKKVLAAITPRTRAIIAVHLYGLPANMSELRSIINQCSREIFLIEDAAEAIGATYKNQPIGSLSNAAIFSFYGNKTITTGEGGMVVTNNETLAQRLRFLRGQAQDLDTRYYHPEIGFNYRMTDIQAAIGCAQMDKIAFLTEKRLHVWTKYADAFEYGQRQHFPIDSKHAGWMFVVLLKDNRECAIAAQELEKQGIETRPVFVPLNLMPQYHNPRVNYRVSYMIRNRGLCLPTHANLKDEDIERIVTIVKGVMS